MSKSPLFILPGGDAFDASMVTLARVYPWRDGSFALDVFFGSDHRLDKIFASEAEANACRDDIILAANAARNPQRSTSRHFRLPDGGIVDLDQIAAVQRLGESLVTIDLKYVPGADDHRLSIWTYLNSPEEAIALLDRIAAAMGLTEPNDPILKET